MRTRFRTPFLDAFTAWSALPGITQYNDARYGLADGPVTSWPDQTGNNRTPNNTAAARPTALLDALGFRAIDAPWAGTPPAEFMPATSSGATKGNFTVAAILRLHSFKSTAVDSFYVNTASTMAANRRSNLMQLWQNPSTYTDVQVQQLCNTHLFGVDSTGLYRCNGYKFATAQVYGTTAALPPVAVFGAGNNTTSLRCPGIIHALAVFDHALSDAEWLALQQYPNQVFAVPLGDFTRQLIWHGDSLAFGHTTTNHSSPPQLLEAYVNTNWLRQNIGIPGATLAFLELGSHVTNDGTSIYVIDPTLPSTMVFSLGANDLLSVSPANLLAGVIRCATYYKANGLDRFIAETVTPRTGLLDATRLTYNALLRANTDPAIDAIADPGGDPILGDYANIGNPTYFNADQIHMANGGNLIRARCAAAAMGA